MELIRALPAQAAAQDLELALGDPSDPDAPVSFARLVGHDEREEPPSEAFDALRARGIHAHLVPGAWGGRLTSFDELLALVRVISRRDLVLTTGLGSTMLAAVPVWAWGGDDQRREVADLLLATGAFGCFAVSERDAGSDFQATTTRAEPTAGGHLLRGEKWLIGNASRCDFVVTLARTRQSLSLLYLRPDQLSAGTCRRLPRIRTLGLRGHDLGGMVFEDCLLPASALIQPAGRGMEMALTTLQFTRTMIGGMALGAADTALRLALGWSRERRLYGQPIFAIPAVRALLLGAFLDILIGECLAMVTARALTLAPCRTPLWAAVTKYLVPNLSERVVRDASVVLSARSYLREGIADGVFQKIARDITITSIFEGTQLVQLSLIASQLGQLKRAGRRGGTPVDLDQLCDLASPAPAWDPPSTALRVGDPGGDELVERWFRWPESWPEDLNAGPRATSALRSLRDQATALWTALAESAGLADLSLARRYCILHAAACCLEIWRCNRERMAPEAAGGEWLALCLERLACGDGLAPAAGDLAEPVSAWMQRQLEEGELFSIVPFELAR
ncbi:acyl-CoA dehydrogenase family protein [Candidatus Nephthysia bennettiae]|uniref:Acyl-CoA dehydrogenase family protein n=1 Tax=Candidatus Nephthysia bennettiae TaxID=3127016 RepID=A0A934K673_9BACT|nr:acyl-CoA dehydrogenase family protein [Candidatus Dormibacteraeota bacterium]